MKVHSTATLRQVSYQFTATAALRQGELSRAYDVDGSFRAGRIAEALTGLAAAEIDRAEFEEVMSLLGTMPATVAVAA